MRTFQLGSTTRDNAAGKRTRRRSSLTAWTLSIVLLASPMSTAATTTTATATTTTTTATTTTTKGSSNIVLKPKPARSPNPLPNPSYQAIVMLPLTTAGDALEDPPSKRFADATSSFWIGVEKKEREEHLLKSTWQTNKETKKDSIFDRLQKKRKSGGDHSHGTESTDRSGGGGISQFLPTMRNGKLQHVKMQATTSNNTLVLFYDVDDGTNTSELPDHVYHENGTKVHINDVLSNGLPIIMEHPPPPPGADSPPSNSTVFVASDATASSETSSGTSQSNNDSSSSSSNTTTRSTAAVYNFQDNSNSNSNVQKKHVNPHDWENMPQAQDQMIIVSTVATMALLVGALSARRLRSRHFLSSCIENESLEDELAYDTAYTTTGGRGSGYDTFGGGGSSGGSALPWRGDLEKFDV